MEKDRSRRSLRWWGGFLVIVSVIGLLVYFEAVIVAEVRYEVKQLLGTEPGFLGRIFKISAITSEEVPDANFSIMIPKIGVASRVMANVDPGDEQEYMAALREGVAHAKGTGFPGVTEGNRTIYLFAHSTSGPLEASRLNAVFYLLRKLEAGDEIVVYFNQEKQTYQVKEKKVVEAADVTELVPQTGSERLVLQTCYPPGTRWKRLLVIAEPKQLFKL